MDQQLLKAILEYDPLTGAFSWNQTRSGPRKKGHKAGTITNGYGRIGIEGKFYYSHRLAWLYMTGSWPKGELDHINGNRADNRWTNLREVTPMANTQNRTRANHNNGTGFLGVYKRPSGRFGARIRINKQNFHLGVYDTPEEAYQAYLTIKRQFHKGCTI